MIHSTAIIEEGAILGSNCEIHPFAVIKKHCILGDDVTIHPFSVIGGDPQFLKFEKSTSSFVRIGNGTVIREHVTINRSIHEGQLTTIGANCFFMAGSHAAHDCMVGNNVVLANNALLAGHVSIGDNAFIGGGAALHQFSRVGESAMVGGLSRISRDIPPYCLVAERDEISGLNLVGLKRRGFAHATILEIKECFRAVFSSAGNIRRNAEVLLGSGKIQSAEAKKFLIFFSEGKRSFARPSRHECTDIASNLEGPL